ncbi:MAG TPA: type III-A CRISPR-associated RAMP protein Csm4 [Anaerolineales bacterium]|nr:type III-A CRISPR-associated RAMP protein Csm4 [Anaerolineales bacterium]
MPQLTIYHLTFPHGIHIGAGGVESVEESRESVPSDTLFAALLDTWRHLGRDVNKILPENGEPAFRVTSAFPFAGGVRFYPKPVDLRELFKEKTLKAESAGKRLKKIRYVSEKLLLKAAGGEYLDGFLFPEDENKDPKTGIALQGGAFWMLPDEIQDLPEAWRLPEKDWWLLRRKKVYDTQTAPRVTVDRVSSASNLFQSERVVFNAGCGLWFGAVAVGQTFSLSELLTVLGDSGLGGERTAGYGHFTWEPKGELPLNAPQSAAYLLSRWHPKADEISLLQRNSAYKLEAVEGWLRTPENAAAQRRKRLWLVSEGSLIAGNPQGDAANVTPEYEDKEKPGTYIRSIPHNVYRPGFALALNWKRKVTP